MEIITYVLSGELEHQDSMGNRGVVTAGGVQYMSAGTGVRHSEFNHSRESELHLVQMWVLPAKQGLAPQYGQRDFTVDDRRNRWLRVAGGPSGDDAAIRLGQDAAFSVARLEDAEVRHNFRSGRLGFLFVADGSVQANGEQLGAGDAVRIAGLSDLKIEGDGEILLWDVPPAG
jgi:redox-sensitive bicupin YhaK (pirin superfamily)